MPQRDYEYQERRRSRPSQGEEHASRRAQANRARRRKPSAGRTASFVLLYVAGVIGASILLACVGWILAGDVLALNKPEKEVTITISNEDSFKDVVDRLKEEGLIEYKWLFKLFASFTGGDEDVTMGTYTLNTDMDYRALIVGMHSSSGNLNADTVTVTIPEGYTVEQIIQLLAENDVSDAAALEESAKNHVFDKFDFVDNENLGSVSRLEGYLFPDTYEFYVKENADSALSRLLSNFQDRIMDDPDIAPLIADSSYSLKEIVIMASLIEKETDGTDRAVISSVIHNRLENVGETAHLLQIDASLVYAAGREITEDDYQTLDSPYNLYTHQGLPPTAIANAGKASIVAALKPDKTNYYFYVLNPDTQRHVFSRTLAEHNANLRKFG